MEYLVKVQDYLKLKIKDTYRLAHSYRVANIGKEIAEKEGLNVEDLMIACLLHDVSYCTPFKTQDEWQNPLLNLHESQWHNIYHEYAL